MSITLIVGKHRWRRRRAVARLGGSAVDDFGRPGFLYITDTHRKRRQVARDFADRNVFEPDGRVLTDLLVDLWHRWGDGRAVLPPSQVALHAQRMLSEGSHPALLALGRPDVTGRQLARLLDAVGQSLQPLRLLDLQEAVRSGLSDLAKRCRTDRSLLAADAFTALVDRLKAPDPGLERWLGLQPPVVVDDVLQPTPARTRALLALLDAFDAAGTDVVLAFECGRATNAADLAGFFGGEEPDPLSYKAFAATRSLRRAVFDRFVANGRAQLVLATEDGPVPIGPGFPFEDHEEPPDLADVVFSDVSVEADPRVAIWACASPIDESERTAAEVRAALDDGAGLEDCLVAVADPARVAGIRRALERLGVPVDDAEGTALSDTPPGQLALMVLRTHQPELGPLSARDWLALGDLAGLDLRGLARALDSAGIRSGPPSRWPVGVGAWARRVGLDDAELEVLTARIDALADLEAGTPDWTSSAKDHEDHSLSPDTPDGWLTHIRACMRRFGLEVLTERTDRNRRARGALEDVLEAWSEDLQAVHEGPWLLSDALPSLQTALRTTRIPGARGGVALTGLLELRGLTPPYIWVLGLTRSSWPIPQSTSPIVDTRTARVLQPVDRLAEARYLLGSLLRNAVGDPSSRSLVLSWPVTIGGQPATPSPVLTELLQRPMSTGPGAKTIRETLVQTVLSEPPSPIPPDDAASDPSRLESLRHPPPPPRALSVTAAETALSCPARYWYRHVLRLDPHDPWDPELEPRRRGTAIHAILQRFYEERDRTTVSEAERTSARADLHRIASAVLDEVEAEGGFDPVLQAWARDRWLAGLVDDRPLGVLGAWLELEILHESGPVAVETPIRLSLPGPRPLTLRGTVDRIDRTPGGHVRVTDYKTGRPPTRARMDAGLSLQPLVYVQAVAGNAGANDADEADGAVRSIASTFQTLARADQIQSQGWYGDEAAMRAFGARRGNVVESEERRDRLADVTERVWSVLDGAIPTTRWGETLAGCSYCSFRTICRVRHDSAEDVEDDGARAGTELDDAP